MTTNLLPAGVYAQYGAPGVGKTTDLIMAFPTALYFGADRSIHNTAAEVLGLHPSRGISFAAGNGETLPIPRTAPAQWGVTDLRRLNERLKWMLEKGMFPERVPAIVVDEVSTLASAVMPSLEAANVMRDKNGNPRLNDDGTPKVDTRSAFGDLARLVDNFMFTLDEVAQHIPVVISGHEKESGVDDAGKRYKGHFRWPSKNRATATDKVFDVNVRMIRDKKSPNFIHGSTYLCDYDDPDWLVRNRFGWKGTVPGNMRAMFRECTQRIILPLVAGLEWQDDVAEQVASLLAAQSGSLDNAANCREALTQTLADLDKARDFYHARWAVSDGIAMAQLRLKRAEQERLAVAPQTRTATARPKF